MSEQQTSERVLRGIRKAYARRGVEGLVSFALYVARNGKDTPEVVRALRQSARRADVRPFAAGIELGMTAAQQSGNQAE